MAICATCDGELDDNTNSFECDGCTAASHYKCGGVTKKDIAARTSSKNLRLYCMKYVHIYTEILSLKSMRTHTKEC